MKKSIFLLAIFCALAFVSTTQESSALGEDLRPWKVIPLDSGFRIFELYPTSYLRDLSYNYHYLKNVKYLSKDSSLIYIMGDTAKFRLYAAYYNLNAGRIDSLIRLKYDYDYWLAAFTLSEDGKYYFTSLSKQSGYNRRIVRISDGQPMEKQPLTSFETYLNVDDVFFDNHSDEMVEAQAFVDESPRGDYGNEICKFNLDGNVIDNYSTGNLTQILSKLQSPDGKWFAALYCAPLVYCPSQYYDNLAKEYEEGGGTGSVVLFNYNDFSEHYNIKPAPANSDLKVDSVKLITQNNLPFRFSQDSKRLYVQNIYCTPINNSGDRNKSFYCFVYDLEHIAENHEPIDTIYLGYPLRQAFWCNNDKNVIIFENNSNQATLLETTNYTKVNEVNLASSNGRVLHNWNVYPDADLIIAYNYPSGDTLGNIEIFKISGIAGVNDEETITSVLYPNPATQAATLELNLPSSNEIDLDISDLTGRVLRTQNCGRLASGLNSIAINTSALSSGSYFVTARGNNYSKTFKLIIKK